MDDFCHRDITHAQQLLAGLAAVTRQGVALDVDEDHVGIETGLDQKLGHDQSVGTVVAGTCKDHRRLRRTPAAQNLVDNTLGHTVYQLHRADTLVVDSDTIDMTYIFSCKNFHLSANFSGRTLPIAKIRNKIVMSNPDSQVSWLLPSDYILTASNFLEFKSASA